MTNYEAFRAFESSITERDLDEAVERSNEATEWMREHGNTISYLGSDVFMNEDGEIAGTVCHYDAESEDVVREHSERADLPITSVFIRGTAIPGVAPMAGVGKKATA